MEKILQAFIFIFLWPEITFNQIAPEYINTPFAWLVLVFNFLWIIGLVGSIHFYSNKI